MKTDRRDEPSRAETAKRVSTPRLRSVRPIRRFSSTLRELRREEIRRIWREAELEGR
jgi:hypothetical protein